MKKITKIGVAALAVSAFSAVFANEVEAESVSESRSARVAALQESVIGWTPVAVGLATPVQLPWGIKMWDVYGLDLNLFYSDAPRMYGIDVSLGGCTTRDKLIGMAVSGIFNYADADIYGLRASGIVNMCNANLYGVDIGSFGMHRNIYGVDVELLGGIQENVCGLQLSGLANITKVESYGATVALGANIARVAHGFQGSLVFNQTEELHGCQISLVNIAQRCEWGFQIGLVNLIFDNKVKVLPIINGYFGEQVTR